MTRTRDGGSFALGHDQKQAFEGSLRAASVACSHQPMNLLSGRAISS